MLPKASDMSIPIVMSDECLVHWRLMVKPSITRKFWIALAVTGGIIAAIGVITLYDKYTLPDRLTTSLRGSAVHGELFTKSKLINFREEGPVNLNGDGSMEGVFQLSKAEVETLLASDPPLKCAKRQDCDIENTDYSLDKTKTHYCSSRNEHGGVLYVLCVDTQKNQVEWRVMWY